MNRLDSSYPLNLGEYKLFSYLIDNDYFKIRFFDRKKLGKDHVCFEVDSFMKLYKKHYKKLRQINPTIKQKYYWCEAENNFRYFYEVNRNNNWREKDYELVYKLNEEKLTLNVG